MRSTTTLIAAVIALSACGPVTVQFAPAPEQPVATQPVAPAEPVSGADDGDHETGERQYGGNPDRPDPHAAPDEESKDAAPAEEPAERDYTDPQAPSDDDDGDGNGEAEPPADDDDAPAPNIHPANPETGRPPVDGDPTDDDDRADGLRPARPEPVRPREDGRIERPVVPADTAAARPARPTRPERPVTPTERERPGRDGQRPPNIHPERPDLPEPPVADEPDQPEPPVADEPDQPEPPIADEPDLPEPPVADEPDQPEPPVADVDLGTPRDIHIPPGHMPRGDECRLWIEGTPPGRQADAVECDELHGEIPDGAFVLYDDRVWDTEYDWVLHEQRNPGSVPGAILDLMRSL